MAFLTSPLFTLLISVARAFVRRDLLGLGPAYCGLGRSPGTLRARTILAAVQYMGMVGAHVSVGMARVCDMKYGGCMGHAL